jgi:hypothetical protein
VGGIGSNLRLEGGGETQGGAVSLVVLLEGPLGGL